MITLDQIKQLDFKVRKAIDKINSLKNDNNMLQEKLDSYQIRIEELEILIDTFKEDQGEIEHGIIDALNQLDVLEDNIITPLEKKSSEQDSSESQEETKDPAQEEIPEEKSDKQDGSSEEETLTSIVQEDEKENEEEEDETSNDSEVELDIF